MSWVAETLPLADLLVRGALRDPDHEAFVFPGLRLTYRELLDRAMARAGSLIGLGVEPGERVGILMPNHPDVVELLFGASLIGAVPVPINARFRERELGYVITDAELAVLVTTDVVAEHVDYVRLLHASIPGLEAAVDPRRLDLGGAPRSVVALGSGAAYPGMVDRETFERLSADASEIHERRVRVRLRDPAFMIYTSGTTADPKGCPLSHEAFVRTAIAIAGRFGLGPADRYWAPMPLFHLSAILPMAATFATGGTFSTLSHFTPDAGIEQLIAERPTVAATNFVTIMNALLAHPRWPEVDKRALRVIINVGPEELLRRYQDALPHTVQVSAYGLSEAAGVVGYNELTDTLEQRLTTGGRPFPGVQVQIVDPETLDVLDEGERGEIWIRGHSIFEGYWNDPVKQAESVTSDGWLRSGDIGSLAGGRVRFHGRFKDMLKVGGENVAAVEIESHLASHPAVKLAQVVGMPDDRLAEVPIAFVELHAGASVTEAELVDFCKGAIASFKVPRRVVFTTDWPMSATKIQKFRLRERLEAGA